MRRARGMSRALALALVGLSAAPRLGATEPLPVRQELVAVSAGNVTWLPASQGPYAVPHGSGLRFWLRGAKGAERAAAPGSRARELGFSAPSAGHFDEDLGSVVLRVDAVEVQALDHRGARVDPSRSHASLSRSLPSELGSLPAADQDALRFLVIAPSGVDVPALQIASYGAALEPLDAQPRLQVEPTPCPSGVAPELVCRRSLPLRAVGDALDRGQGLVRERSVRAALGGTLRVSLAHRPLLELKVGGPRETRWGPIERLRARLRVLVLRQRAGGPPALGGSDAQARQIMLKELSAAGGLWAQCGIELGPPSGVPIQIVDPPSAQLVTVGCGLGQPASGGELRLRVGKRSVRVPTTAGESPVAVASRLAEALGGGAKVFENPRASGDAVATADVLLERAPKLELLADAPLSSDVTLPLCISGLDLSDGLRHFGDVDAFVGTVEERTLLRAFDDGDAGTIEVLVVPSFERSERIGESFILTRGSSLSSSVIIDREAIRAGARSFALAHELGHVFLAMPGHPDDFGVDQSWSLMDADVADATVFGPRRLSVADCERALAQSGPGALVPLLTPVPLR